MERGSVGAWERGSVGAWERRSVGAWERGSGGAGERGSGGAGERGSVERRSVGAWSVGAWERGSRRSVGAVGAGVSVSIFNALNTTIRVNKTDLGMILCTNSKNRRKAGNCKSSDPLGKSPSDRS